MFQVSLRSTKNIAYVTWQPCVMGFIWWIILILIKIYWIFRLWNESRNVQRNQFGPDYLWHKLSSLFSSHPARLDTVGMLQVSLIRNVTLMDHRSSIPSEVFMTPTLLSFRRLWRPYCSSSTYTGAICEPIVILMGV